ncbi:MAG: hypothetical protein JWR32_2566 [Mycobacterium sp.]|jgi:hypothetical protein|nr:hypothetical protein [Mycobacterium sp.]
MVAVLRKLRAQRRDLAVERQIEISHGAVRHADAESVVTDQCVVVCDPFPESPDVRTLPVEFEVTHPPRRSDERWSVPAHLLGQATRAEG